MVDLSAISTPVLVFGIVLSLTATLDKLIGSGIPAFFSGFNRIGSLRIGVGMIPRGEIALIIAGMDRKGTRVFVTDPSGTYVPYSAVAIGGNSDEVTDFLEKNYKEGMSTDDAMSLAISAINLKNEEEGVKHIRMSKIGSDTKQFEKVSNEELVKHAPATGGSSK